MTERVTRTFSERNRARCEAVGGFNHTLSSWTLSDWFTALAGEVGEAGNVIKKMNRLRDRMPGNKATDVDLLCKLGEELADCAIYLDLLAQAAGFDLDTIRERKFQQTNERLGYTEEG